MNIIWILVNIIVSEDEQCTFLLQYFLEITNTNEWCTIKPKTCVKQVNRVHFNLILT